MIYSYGTGIMQLFARANSKMEARMIFVRSLRAQANENTRNAIRVSFKDIRVFCEDFENAVKAPGLIRAITKYEKRGTEDFGKAPRYSQIANDRLAPNRATVSISI